MKKKDNIYLKQKLLLVTLGLLIVLLIVEGAFRIGGIIAYKGIEGQPGHEGAFKILCVGDSSTFGLGATSRSKFSYPAQLQRILEERYPAKKVQVINLGIPGINSTQLANRFEGYILKYNPDVVIVQIGANDWWNLEESHIDRFYNTDPLRRLILSIELLLNNLRVYQFLKLSSQSIRLNRMKVPDFPGDESKRIYKTFFADPVKTEALFNIMEENIRKMRDIAHMYDVKSIFVEYHVDNGGPPHTYLHQIYSEFKVPVVENNDIIFAKAERWGIKVFSEDNWHPNDTGYLLIARSIYNKLVDEGILIGEKIELFENLDFRNIVPFYEGFYNPERWPPMNHRWRWSKKEGVISIPAKGIIIELAFQCNHPDIDREPVIVSLLLNGNFLDMIIFTDKKRQLCRRYYIPDSIKGVAELVIKVSRTWNPYKYGISNDNRDLGIALRDIKFINKKPIPLREGGAICVGD
jgi:lysophospholipase L1-like esterase